MTIVFEISRPFQIKPGLYRSPVTLRVWWLWFALSIHPMREDQLIQQARDGVLMWESK